MFFQDFLIVLLGIEKRFHYRRRAHSRFVAILFEKDVDGAFFL
jgi:hypothetical protein